MLLTVAPKRSSLLAADNGAAEVEYDYRDGIEYYLPEKRRKYLNRGNTSLLVATVQALKKSFKSRIRGSSRDDLRLYLLPSLYDVYSGEKGSHFKIAFTDVNDASRVLAKFHISEKSRERLTFLAKDANTLAVHLNCEPTEIPSLGRYVLSAKSSSLQFKKKFFEVYDFNDIHALKTVLREGQTKQVVIQIPCYSASAAAQISKLGLPATEIQLMVDVTADSRSEIGYSTRNLKCTVVGARVLCSLQAESHSTIFSHRVHLNDHPTYSVSRATRLMTVVDKSLSASPASASSGITDTINSVVAGYLSRANGGQVPQFSWSVTHLDKVVLSHRGLDRYNVGQIGEVPFGLAVLRAANGVSPSNWSDLNLCAPAGLEKLLHKAGAHKVLAALKSLYSGCGRIPSVLELLTHSAGLPQLSSVDADVDFDLLERILPGSASGPLSDDRETRFARVLSERVHLIAPPGCVVHFSSLGYAVLSYCFANLPQTLKNLFSELGMDSTRLERPQPSDQDPCYPDDPTNLVSNCTTSTTNDLCRYLACVEKANIDPCAHPFLAHSMVPCYLASDYGRGGMHSVCNGGMESCVVKLRLANCASAKKAEKVSLNVFFKFGERAGVNSTLLVWIPGLHTGLALCSASSFRGVFGRSKEEMGYGKCTKKPFSAKHLIKSLLQQACSALSRERGSCFDLDQEADLAYSITPKLPPRYSEYAQRCSKLPDHPEGALEGLLTKSSLFTEDGVAFYPLYQSVSEIKRKVYSVPASVQVNVDSVFERLKGIRIFRKKHQEKDLFFIHDGQNDEVTQLVYDKETEIRVGLAAAQAKQLHRGSLRKLSVHRSGDVAEHVTFHILSDILPDKLLGIQHRGCLYVSKRALQDVKISFDKQRLLEEETRIQSTRTAVDSKYFPWNLPIGNNIAEKQKPIEASAGAVLGAGALGLGVGALAGAAIASSARPYAYYPPPPYPYYYYRRPRPVYVAPAPVYYY